jgi:hypothetical protein
MILERYFSLSGRGANIVLPKQQELQDKLISQATRDLERNRLPPNPRVTRMNIDGCREGSG